jgi:hypothetical protein
MINLEPENAFKDKIDQIKDTRTNYRNIIGINLAINHIFFKKYILSQYKLIIFDT